MTAVKADLVETQSPSVNTGAFLAAMSKAASSVCVVTTQGEDGRSGITISSMTSMSADPPSILICVRRESPTAAAILRNWRFCVSMLRDDQSHVSDIFAGRGLPGVDRFACADWRSLTTGCPALEGAATAFDCEMADVHVFGSHCLFIGRVVDVANDPSTATLVYHDRKYCKLSTAASI